MPPLTLVDRPKATTIICILVRTDGREYLFFYNPYAELARIENPDGGAVEYDMGPGFTASSGVFGATTGVLQSQTTQRQVYRRVLESRTYPNGGTGSNYETRTTYSRDSLAYQTHE